MSDTFCILPYIHHHIDVEGKTRLCCNAKPNPNLKSFGDEEYVSIRQKLNQGEKIIECQKCWDREAKGITSFRQKANAKWQNKIPKLDSKHVLSVDYRLTNHCNFACVFCGPHNSTKWAVLQKKSNILNKTESQIDTEKLEYVYLAGGEPLLVPEFKMFVKNIKNKNQTEIVINTNLSQIDDEWIEILNQFDKKCLTISVDASYQLGEYVRWPMDWKNFENNINKVIHNKISIMFHCVMCNINYLDFDILADWMMQYNPSVVEITECISPYQLNLDILKKYQNSLFVEKTKKFINHKLVNQHMILKKFFISQLSSNKKYDQQASKNATLDFLKQQDSLKQICFSNVKCTFNDCFEY